MIYKGSKRQLNDNLGLPAGRHKELEKAMDLAVKGAMDDHPDGFNLNQLLPRVAGEIRNEEEAFYVGWHLGTIISKMKYQTSFLTHQS